MITINEEEYRGYMSAKSAIERDGDTLKAAKYHRGVASSDIRPTKFTVGWKQACDDFIDECNAKGIR